MKIFKIKTENPNCKIIIIDAIHVLAALDLAFANYHGLIEEEILSVKQLKNS